MIKIIFLEVPHLHHPFEGSVGTNGPCQKTRGDVSVMDILHVEEFMRPLRVGVTLGRSLPLRGSPIYQEGIGFYKVFGFFSLNRLKLII